MLYLILLYLSVIYIFRNKLNDKVKFIFLLLPLLGIIWTRYGIGADYFSYQDMYLKLDTRSFSSLFNNYYNIEVGYKLLMWPFRLLGVPYYIFLGIVNSIVTIVILKWLDDNSSDVVLSTLLFYAMFFLVWVLSAVRQSIVLAFSLYFLFNEKKNLSLSESIRVVLILSLFHMSALFIFVYLLLRQIKWNKKLHLLFMGVALFTTFLPLGSILSQFRFIPGVSKIIENYLDSSIRFYDFPGLIRLGVFATVIIFYDQLTVKKKHADALLYGMSFYFLLKFSELTASRATIYTFFMILVLVPEIVKSLGLERIRLLKYVVTISLITGAGVYFTKEFRTMFQQAEYIHTVDISTYPNLFNKNISDFGSLQAFEVNLYTSTLDNYELYQDDSNNPKQVYNENQTYKSIKQDGKYRLLGQDGSIIEDLESKMQLEIIDGILLENYYEKGYFFTNKRVKDLTNQNRSETTMKKTILDFSENRSFEHKEERIEYDFEDLPKELQSYYPNKDKIGKFVVNKMEGYVDYYIVRIEYHNRVSFIYLDDKRKAILPMPVKMAKLYDSKGFLSISSYETNLIVNETGNIIWWEK